MPWTGELEITTYRAFEVPSGTARREVTVPARGGLTMAVLELFDGFSDTTFAYRFGPPSCDVLVATFRTPNDVVQAFLFPTGLPQRRELDIGLRAEAVRDSNGDYELTLETRRFAQSIVIDVAGYASEDHWFHLPPGAVRKVPLRRASLGHASPALRGTVRALNSEAVTKIVVVG
jgi:beta-mannosidase